MDKKKIFSKKIIIPVVILILVVSAICIFLITNNKKDNKPAAPDASNVSQTEVIENEINIDVLNKKICQEYNGNYTFKSIVDVSFDRKISYENEKLIYGSISGFSDKNSFIYYLYNKKVNDSKNEIITLVNGKYVKTKNNRKVENGIFYGNLNKSYVYVLDKDGSIEIDNRNYSIVSEISNTGYWLVNNIDQESTTIYIREKYVYDNVSGNYLYVTYAYSQIG